MSADPVDPTEQCCVDGCGGVRAPSLDKCFVHADDNDVRLAVGSVEVGGVLDLRCTPLTQNAVDGIFQAFSESEPRVALDVLDLGAARPTEAVTFSSIVVDRLKADDLVSDFALAFESVEVRTVATMYDLRAAELQIGLVGAGRVKMDRLRTDWLQFDLRNATTVVRGDPVYAAHTIVRGNDGDRGPDLTFALIGDECTMSGEALARVDMRTSRLSSVEVVSAAIADGMSVAESSIDTIVIERCSTSAIRLDGAELGQVAVYHCGEIGLLVASGTTVQRDVLARETVFGDISARGATIRMLDLVGCTTGAIDLTNAKLGHLVLDRIDAGGVLSLSDLDVCGHASLRGARLNATMIAHRGNYGSSLSLTHAVAEQDILLTELEVTEILGLDDLQACGDVTIGNASCGQAVAATRATIARSLNAELTAPKIDLEGSHVRGSSRLLLTADSASLADVVLDDRAELTCRGYTPPRACTLDLQAIEPRERLHVDGQERSALIDLRRARCDGIQLQGLALERCLFAGATGLAELRLTGDSFARLPAWRKLGRGRVVVAEDPDFSIKLLADSTGKPGPEAEERLASRVAASAAATAQRYRSLRKGLEDSKDSAGASEFYFSEMQMRRRMGTASRFERGVVWAYRAIGGYGVRPLAPFIALVCLILVVTFVADQANAIRKPIGPDQELALPAQACRLDGGTHGLALRCPAGRGVFTMPESKPESDFAAQGLSVVAAAAGLSRSAAPRLTRTGDVLIISVRLIGAVLLALIALGLRSVVRR